MVFVVVFVMLLLLFLLLLLLRSIHSVIRCMKILLPLNHLDSRWTQCALYLYQLALHLGFSYSCNSIKKICHKNWSEQTGNKRLERQRITDTKEESTVVVYIRVCVCEWASARSRREYKTSSIFYSKNCFMDLSMCHQKENTVPHLFLRSIYCASLGRRSQNKYTSVHVIHYLWSYLMCVCAFSYGWRLERCTSGRILFLLFFSLFHHFALFVWPDFVRHICLLLALLPPKDKHLKWAEIQRLTWA